MNEALYYTGIALWSFVASYVVLFNILPRIVKKKKSGHVHSNVRSTVELKRLREKKPTRVEDIVSLLRR